MATNLNNLKGSSYQDKLPVHLSHWEDNRSVFITALLYSIYQAREGYGDTLAIYQNTIDDLNYQHVIKSNTLIHNINTFQLNRKYTFHKEIDKQYRAQIQKIYGIRIPGNYTLTRWALFTKPRSEKTKKIKEYLKTWLHKEYGLSTYAYMSMNILNRMALMLARHPVTDSRLSQLLLSWHEHRHITLGSILRFSKDWAETGLYFGIEDCYKREIYNPFTHNLNNMI